MIWTQDRAAPAGTRETAANGRLHARHCKVLPAHAQAGSIAVTSAGMLLVIIAFCGFVLDLARVYNRNFEMRNVADTAALAAARELNGTAGGINSAVTAAASAVEGPDALKYGYAKLSMSWSNAAIKFSKSSGRAGTWVDAGTAAAAPQGYLFVKVDTGALDEGYGIVQTVFMNAVGPALHTGVIKGVAVAGRSDINVTPFAVCAMSPDPAHPLYSRDNTGGYLELAEYGFRRGVSYDLMQLNRGPLSATSTGVTYVIDPITPPGGAGSVANTDPAVVGPYVCAGTMSMPKVMGAPITVAQPFPLSSLFNQINSRFDKYVGGLCNPNAAPPDANVRPYVANSNISWMSTAQGAQTAALSTDDGEMWTVADPHNVPGGTTAAMYGPLWSYARAVPFSSYVQGSPEPATGYATYAATNTVWSKLYSTKAGSLAGPGVGVYPSGSKTPYSAKVNLLPPSASHGLGVPNRRVLNVPLLDCPIAGANSASVLAIGRFFLTVPATATSISAEFAGAVTDDYVKGHVELYP